MFGGSIYDQQDNMGSDLSSKYSTDKDTGSSLFSGGTESSLFDTAVSSTSYGYGSSTTNTKTSIYDSIDNDSNSVSSMSSMFDNKEDNSMTTGSIHMVDTYAVGATQRDLTGFNSNGLNMGEEAFYQDSNEDNQISSYMNGNASEEDKIAGMLNVRANVGGSESIVDSMRGNQANRFSLSGDEIGLADMYNDSALDTRVADGRYNVTVSDIYSNEKIYNEFHGLNTDGKVDIRENYLVDLDSASSITHEQKSNENQGINIDPNGTNSLYMQQKVGVGGGNPAVPNSGGAMEANKAKKEAQKIEEENDRIKKEEKAIEEERQREIQEAALERMKAKSEDNQQNNSNKTNDKNLNSTTNQSPIYTQSTFFPSGSSSTASTMGTGAITTKRESYNQYSNESNSKDQNFFSENLYKADTNLNQNGNNPNNGSNSLNLNNNTTSNKVSQSNSDSVNNINNLFNNSDTLDSNTSQKENFDTKQSSNSSEMINSASANKNQKIDNADNFMINSLNNTQSIYTKDNENNKENKQQNKTAQSVVSNLNSESNTQSIYTKDNENNKENNKENKSTQSVVSNLNSESNTQSIYTKDNENNKENNKENKSTQSVVSNLNSESNTQSIYTKDSENQTENKQQNKSAQSVVSNLNSESNTQSIYTKDSENQTENKQQNKSAQSVVSNLNSESNTQSIYTKDNENNKENKQQNKSTQSVVSNLNSESNTQSIYTKDNENNNKISNQFNGEINKPQARKEVRKTESKKTKSISEMDFSFKKDTSNNEQEILEETPQQPEMGDTKSNNLSFKENDYVEAKSKGKTIKQSQSSIKPTTEMNLNELLKLKNELREKLQMDISETKKTSIEIELKKLNSAIIRKSF